MPPRRRIAVDCMLLLLPLLLCESTTVQVQNGSKRPALVANMLPKIFFKNDEYVNALKNGVVSNIFRKKSTGDNLVQWFDDWPSADGLTEKFELNQKEKFMVGF